MSRVGLRTGPARASPRERPHGLLVASLSALLVLSLGACESGARTGSTGRPVTDAAAVSSWREGVREDYQSLASASLAALQTLNAWEAGEADASQAAVTAKVALEGSQATGRALADRRPAPGTDRSLFLFRASADLYAYSFRTVLTAAALAPGDMQTQLLRSAARLRDLGDRVFDQGSDGVENLLPPQPDVEGVEVRRAPDVTDYDSVDLGAGPPLEPRAQTPRPLRTYQADRPEQSVAAWRKALADLAPPTATEVSALIASGSPDELAAAARTLTAVADALHAMPDPQDGRRDSTQLQLGLQASAEALRAAQAGALLGAQHRGELRNLARDVSDLAGDLRREIG
jgi:hypothetical protein